MEETALRLERWKVMEGKMETVENGKDVLIHIVLVFVPNMQTGTVAGSRKANEKERG